MGVETPFRRSSEPSDREPRFWNGIAWVEPGGTSGPSETPRLVAALPGAAPAPRLIHPRPPLEPITPQPPEPLQLPLPPQHPQLRTSPLFTDPPPTGTDRLPSHRAVHSPGRRAATATAAALGLLGLAAAIASALGSPPF
jgi:hypothetical protein